ncbi:MAG: hypothetical protein ABI220_04110 [Candidatus Saccharimonadales bacterium]
MGARKSNEQLKRNLTKNTSGTYSVSLPISLVRELRWQVGQQLVIKKYNGHLIIEDWQT